MYYLSYIYIEIQKLENIFVLTVCFLPLRSGDRRSVRAPQYITSLIYIVEFKANILHFKKMVVHYCSFCLQKIEF